MAEKKETVFDEFQDSNKKEKKKVSSSLEEFKSDTVFKIEESNYKLPLKKGGFESMNEYKRFIKNVENMIRRSQEYRSWLSYLKKEMNIDHCFLTDESMDDVSIEIHHHPISLYNLCAIVTDTLMASREMFSSFDVAMIVLGLHFSNKVGYIPLVKTLHEKFHNGKLQIPIELVRGDWQYVMDNFEVSSDIRILIDKYANINKNDLRLAWGKDNYPGINKDSDVKQLEDKSSEERG